MGSDRSRVDIFPKSIFTRRAYEAVGGYEPISYGEDEWLENAILAYGCHAGRRDHHLQRHRWYYIYRLEASPIHLWSLEEDSRYLDIGKLPAQPGRFALQPHWQMDYVAATRHVTSCRSGVTSQPLIRRYKYYTQPDRQHRPDGRMS